jgi:integrase
MNASKRKGEEWPIVIRKGSFSCRVNKLHRTVKGLHFDYFRLAYYEPGGRRVVRDFGALEDAKQAANDVAGAFALGRPDALSFTPEERRDHDAAVAVLAPLGLALYPAAVELAEARRALPPGVRLLDAVLDYAKRHPANAPKVSVREAVDALLEDRENGKASQAYLVKLKSHLERFAGDFTGTLASITGPTLGEWLRNLTSAERKTQGETKRPRRPLGNRTIQNHAGSVVTLFKFARSRGWVSRDLADEIAEVPTAKAEAIEEVGTFTGSQIRRILEAAPEDIRASLALGAFAGLRTEEIHRLDWKEVRLAERVVVVGARKAKTGSRRVVPIAENLALWLAPLHRLDGPVDPSPTSKATTHRWCRIANRVGIPWVYNGLRHSFASYRLAVVQNPAQVAFEMGNSPRMIDRNYKALVTEAQGREWFAIEPKTAEADVLPMPKSGVACV